MHGHLDYTNSLASGFADTHDSLNLRHHGVVQLLWLSLSSLYLVSSTPFAVSRVMEEAARSATAYSEQMKAMITRTRVVIRLAMSIGKDGVAAVRHGVTSEGSQWKHAAKRVHTRVT